MAGDSGLPDDAPTTRHRVCLFQVLTIPIYPVARHHGAPLVEAVEQEKSYRQRANSSLVRTASATIRLGSAAWITVHSNLVRSPKLWVAWYQSHERTTFAVIIKIRRIYSYRQDVDACLRLTGFCSSTNLILEGRVLLISLKFLVDVADSSVPFSHSFC